MQHAAYGLEIKDKERLQQARKRTRARDSSVPKKNPLNFVTISKSTTKQQRFDDNLVDYIVGSMKPFSTVDDEAFVALFSFDKEIKIMSRRTLMRNIAVRGDEDHKKTVAALKEVDEVCTAADIWSSKHHGYMGITCHWLDDELQRRSRVLACRNFKGRHTAERTGEIISKIHDENGLPVQKIVTTITDNDFTMVKAFKLFGVKLVNPALTNDKIGDENDSDSDGDDDEEMPDPEPTDDEYRHVLLSNHQRFVA